MSYHHSYGLPVTVIRSSTLIGEGMRKTQVVPIFLQQALRGDPLTVQGDGSQTRDFNWIDDHCAAMVTALTNPKAAGETINVGSGVERSIRSIAEDCIRVTGSRSTLSFSPYRPGEEGLRVVLDITLARELLNYTPKVSFEEGLERCYRWLATKADRPLAAVL